MPENELIVDTIDKEGENILFLTPNHINGIIFCSPSVFDFITIAHCPPENINNVKIISSLFKCLKPGGEINISLQESRPNCISYISEIKKNLETYGFKFLNISTSNKINKRNGISVKIIKITGKKPKFDLKFNQLPEINNDKKMNGVLLNNENIGIQKKKTHSYSSSNKNYLIGRKDKYQDANIAMSNKYINFKKKVKNYLRLKSICKDLKETNNLQLVQNLQQNINTERKINYNLLEPETPGTNKDNFNEKKDANVKKNWKLDDDDEEEDYMAYGDRGYVVEKKKKKK